MCVCVCVFRGAATRCGGGMQQQLLASARSGHLLQFSAPDRIRGRSGVGGGIRLLTLFYGPSSWRPPRAAPPLVRHPYAPHIVHTPFLRHCVSVYVYVHAHACVFACMCVSVSVCQCVRVRVHLDMWGAGPPTMRSSITWLAFRLESHRSALS